jgi:DNA-binding transcriptional LysR family regulator
MSENLAVMPPITEGHLRLLRIFRAVAEAGGLTAAEARLSMERSTISRHLQTLETKLGAVLCYRGPSGFALTEFGQVALQVAIAAGDTLDMVRDELERALHGVSGDLNLGVADSCLTNPRCRVHQAIAAFREQAPSVTLHLSIRTPDELLRGLEERRLHIGITGTILGNAKIRQHTLFPEQFRLYVGLPDGGDPPSLHELRDRGYVLVTRENDYRTLNLFKRLKFERRAVALGLEAVAMMLVGGGFVGYLPTHYADSMAPLYRLAEVRGSEALDYTTKFAMATMQHHRLPPAAQLLATLLTKAHASPS